MQSLRNCCIWRNKTRYLKKKLKRESVREAKKKRQIEEYEENSVKC